MKSKEIKEIEGNQRKSNEIKGNRMKSKESKEIEGNQRNQRN